MRARLLTLCAALLILAGCGRRQPDSSPATGPALPVHIAIITMEHPPILLEVPATVRPAERANISAKLAGTVATFPLGLGSAVNTGDVLVTLDAPETEARVRQTQAQLAEAARNADRTRTLVEKGVNAPDSLRDAEDRLRFAQAAAAETESLLAYATMRAPFAGVITEKHVLPGDLATPGLPLLVLESTQHLRAEGTIPEKAAVGLHIGDVLPVLLDDASAAIAGRIEEISAAADAVSRSVLGKIALPAGPARSGQFARIQITTGASDALLVPAGAVTSFGQMERVFVAEKGRAVLRLVKTGLATDGRTEILSGLNPGEQIILTPPAALRDGQPITVQQ